MQQSVASFASTRKATGNKRGPTKCSCKPASCTERDCTTDAKKSFRRTRYARTENYQTAAEIPHDAPGNGLERDESSTSAALYQIPAGTNPASLRLSNTRTTHHTVGAVDRPGTKTSTCASLPRPRASFVLRLSMQYSSCLAVTTITIDNPQPCFMLAPTTPPPSTPPGQPEHT